MEKYDVLIIGCGVVGAMTARELMRYRLSVCILEKGNDVSVGASKANSGIIHGGFDPEPGTLKAELNTRGISLLYRAAEELSVPVRRNGSMVVAFDREQEQHLVQLYERGLKNGITRLRFVSGEEARRMEPNLSERVTMALVADDAGIISPYELCIAAAGNAMDNGAALKRNFKVTAISGTDVFTVTAASGEKVQGSYIVNCAGAHSDEIARLMGDNFFDIIPRAGEYMLLDKKCGKLFDHTIFGTPTKEGKGILVSPTAEGNLLLGPTAQRREEKDDTVTTAGGLDDVARMTRNYTDILSLRDVITSFTGVRASTAGGDFLIKASEKNRRCIHAGAIDSPGLTCCVAIAERLVALLRESGLQLTENESFDPRRASVLLRDKTEEEKAAAIKKEPLYGRIVCRCEAVSEGEIRAAIRQNPVPLDLDGVKRRTRSSMGRCQGGFCTPRLMRILAEELGRDVREITKKGGVSRILAKEDSHAKL